MLSNPHFPRMQWFLVQGFWTEGCGWGLTFAPPDPSRVPGRAVVLAWLYLWLFDRAPLLELRTQTILPNALFLQPSGCT